MAHSNEYTLENITRRILNTLGFGDYYDVEQNAAYSLIEYLHWVSFINMRIFCLL